MGQVTISNVDERVIARLQFQAEQHGRSLEQEMRQILERAAEPSWNRLLDELDQARAATPPGTRRLAEELVREDRDRR